MVRNFEPRILSRTVVWQGNFWRVEMVDWTNGRGQVPPSYETPLRNTRGDIAAVCAVTQNREVVLVKSYRVPHDTWVVEYPAGLADKKGESASDLAQRELAEETGFGGGTPLELILRGPFDAGANGDILSVFFTHDVRYRHPPKPEVSEVIKTVLVPLDDFVNFAQRQLEGCLVDIKLMAVVPILQARGWL